MCFHSNLCSIIAINLIHILILSASTEYIRYDNYSLYKVILKTPEQIKMLQDLKDYHPDFNFWNELVPTTKFVNIMANPEKKHLLETFLKMLNIKFVMTIRNVQHMIDNEPVKYYRRTKMTSMEWDSYYSLGEIYDWLEDLAEKFSCVASIIDAGQSQEGNLIKGIKISHGPGRRSIFVEGGMHAREWIAPAVVNYLINELLTSDEDNTMAAAHDFDWYIFPVVNPDGYIWSHVGNRNWRKNRRPFGRNFGVDLNRNWNSNWRSALAANPYTASDTYAGPRPFSEVESKNLAAFMVGLMEHLDLYLSFHSYGQYLLLPYGNTTKPLANYNAAKKIGRRALQALEVKHGTRYKIGNIAEVMYFATGSSIDWVKEVLQVPLVYCYELRDRGTYGHLLPGNQILPTAEETMDSILEIIYQGKKYGYLKSGCSLKASVLVMPFMVVVFFILIII